MGTFSVSLIVLMAARGYFLTETLSVSSSCPRGALQASDSDYLIFVNSTCFLFVLHSSDVFETAQKSCAFSGGTLAMPKTKDVNDFLLQEMRRLNITQPMWIGMNDKAEEGTWIWQDGSEVESWGNIDTDIWRAGWEDCVALDPNDGRWHDFGCSVQMQGVFVRNAELSYICQYPSHDSSQKEDHVGQGKTDDDVKGSVDKNDSVGHCPPFDCYDLQCNGFKYENGCLLCQCED
ncbi:hypothetical protein RRG08_042000 [Elysia crispata]|uniref:C-type lectin domain-containing protein n=1 Tax=Elysia crispata TaxID=231223 RepID=A0AAE1A119_9GAST|nr:hypothetical protein RRG08_042000 [Elysia crispata]